MTAVEITLSIIGIILLCWDVWQLSEAKAKSKLMLKEKELHKSQVKVWQHFANGINHSLITLTEALRQGKMQNLTTAGMEEMLRSVQANSNALYTSLNEERLFSEEEIKQRQLEQEKKMQEFYSASTSPSVKKN